MQSLGYTGLLGPFCICPLRLFLSSLFFLYITLGLSHVSRLGEEGRGVGVGVGVGREGIKEVVVISAAAAVE